MIAFVKGTVAAVAEESIVVEVNGLGYELFCSGSALRAAQVGFGIFLHTYMQVKEDGVTLFGFVNEREKAVFLKLLSVSGVGPKSAISVLVCMSADELAEAVACADAKRLAKVKGLGKKTAEKIILELHGKISAAEVMEVSEEPTKQQSQTPKLSKSDEDAVAALQGLGFTRAEAAQAVQRAKANGASTTEEIIFKALQG
jgi:Holliday junction DNA helicase RuvA